jgi:hypothetical protein
VQQIQHGYLDRDGTFVRVQGIGELEGLRVVDPRLGEQLDDAAVGGEIDLVDEVELEEHDFVGRYDEGVACGGEEHVLCDLACSAVLVYVLAYVWEGVGLPRAQRKLPQVLRMYSLMPHVSMP